MTESHNPESTRRFRLDVSSLAVVPLGIFVILAAQWVDGLSIRSLIHGAAALIVFGGTLGAVLISYSPHELTSACRAAWRAFYVTDDDTGTLAATLVALSVRAHRNGLVSIETDVEALGDPFLREGLTLAVDNMPAEVVEEFVTVERAARAADEEAPARVFEAAAGYAPTLGILGAVLGLIRVMEHLGAPSALGSGIAVAFVSTAYGVGIANLMLLPIAGRLRERAARAARRRELIAQGVLLIHKRVNPRLVAQGLRTFSADARLENVPAGPRPRGVRLPTMRAPGLPA